MLRKILKKLGKSTEQNKFNKKTIEKIALIKQRIDGTRVTGENLPRGLYIIDGKKVLINK